MATTLPSAILAFLKVALFRELRVGSSVKASAARRLTAKPGPARVGSRGLQGFGTSACEPSRSRVLIWFVSRGRFGKFITPAVRACPARDLTTLRLLGHKLIKGIPLRIEM
jgi:hypothetical protein